MAAAAAEMNRIYRHQRHFYDATRKFYLLGRDRLIEGLNALPDEHVLEIGCGTARNLILAAEQYRGARFYGIDVSSEMLETAALAIARTGLAGRIDVAEGDAGDFEPGRLFGPVRFERIYFSYSLSMIPRWQTALERAVSLLSRGGELHIVDFGGQSELPPIFRHGLRRWLALFHVTPRDELETVLAARALRLGGRLAVERPYRDYAQYLRLRLP